MGTQKASFVLAGVRSALRCAMVPNRVGFNRSPCYRCCGGGDLQSGTGSGDVCAVLAGDDEHCVDMLAA